MFRPNVLRYSMAIAVVVLAAVVGFGAWRSGLLNVGGSECPQPASPDQVRMTEVSVASYAGYVVYADCSFWVASTTAGVVQRIDPSSNEVVATISVADPSDARGGSVMALAVHGDQVWASVRNTASKLVRIDTETNAVAHEFPVDYRAYSMLVLDGRAWLADFDLNKVGVIDLNSGELVQNIPLGGGPVQIDAGFGAVWGRSSDSLARMDAETFEVTRYDVPGELGARAIYVTATDTGVWSASPESGIFKISPEGEVLVHIETEAEPVRTAHIDGYVYVGSQSANPDRMEILRIDDVAGTVVDRIPFEFGITEVISSAGGSLWVPVGGADDPRIVRIEVPTLP